MAPFDSIRHTLTWRPCAMLLSQSQGFTLRFLGTLVFITGIAGAQIIPANRMTTWNPGILSDSLLKLPLGTDKLPVRTTVYKTLAPGDDINAAIKSCPAGQVVLLQAGTFTVSSTVKLANGVVLRGAGSQGAAKGGTSIVKKGGGTVMCMGETQDGACYDWGSYSEPACALTTDAQNGAIAVNVGSNASKFKPGDFALIDQVDDSSIVIGDCTFFRRVTTRGVSERVEIVSVGPESGIIGLSSPLRWTFKAASPYSAALTRVTSSVIKWAGIEGLRLQGGSAGSYLGQSAGGIDVSNAAYCWVKDVQTDSTIGGVHVALRGAFRCVVRESYFHNSANYGFGTDCYGIVIGCASSDNLVENNISRYMNKPIQFSNSGGGNVVGYNYTDNAWSDQDGSFQEVPIDAHCAFPHMELVEGNFAPHMALPETHGAAGYITFFRNYASTQFAFPPVYGKTTKQSGNVQAVSICTHCINVNVVGNVLGPVAGSDPKAAVAVTGYISSGFDNGILNFGDSATTPAAKTALLHGNYDNVNKKTMWDASIADHVIPASLYLATKPAFFGSNPWPWVTPDASSPLSGELPAKVRASTGIIGPSGNPAFPAPFALKQNSPNPFSKKTEISFTLSEACDRVNIAVYDLSGKRIAILVDEAKPKGTHTVTWDGRNLAGQIVGKGTYLYAFHDGKGVRITKKMILADRAP
jgi:hypothetical protein